MQQLPRQPPESFASAACPAEYIDDTLSLGKEQELELLTDLTGGG